MATVGRALLILALATAAYGIFASLYGAPPPPPPPPPPRGVRLFRLPLRRPPWTARVGRLRPPRRLRGRGADDVRVRGPRDRVLALGLLVRDGRQPLVDDDAALLPR